MSFFRHQLRLPRSLSNKYDTEYSALTPRLFKVLEDLCLRSWWVVCIFLFCYMLYEHALARHQNEYNRLHEKLIDLENEKNLALDVQQDLILQINSQSDPAWVELVLMKGLGLVPEDHVKVLFTNNE